MSHTLKDTKRFRDRDVYAQHAELFDLKAENKQLREALIRLRGLVKEGGVPRYTVIPGAALNSVIEEVVDPALKALK